MVRHLAEEFVAFADGYAADRITRAIHRYERSGASFTELGKRRSLNNSEECLIIRPRMGLETPLHPLQRATNTLPRFGTSRGIRRALVEGHDDVGAELILNLDRPFRSQVHHLARDFILEAGGLIRNLDTWKRKDLEAAGVGQDRAGPLHE